MKHIDSYELFEKKMVGMIYHFTTPKNLVRILEEDRMKSGHRHISFTRNPDLKAWYEDYGAYCRITFNGSDLSNKFHIEPYLFDPEKDPLFGGGSPASFKERKARYGSEREERIIGEEITGVRPYIIQVDILNTAKHDSESNIKALRKLQGEPFSSMGIQINYVDNFGPVKGHMV